MQKAILNCPTEHVFMKNLLIYKPALPGNNKTKPISKFEVEILEVNGEQALVLLPTLLQQGENETALINLKYLD